MADVIRKATNRFTKGLVMDFSPENTKNEVLTHALNATLLTFNGNELSLQNDMGNARVETAYLPEGYMPVGTCEYGGIIYIVSYNPLENKSQIGCFPSPERNISSEELGRANEQILRESFQNFVIPEGSNVKVPDGTINNTTKYVLLKNDNLNPGDKFLVCAGKEIYNERLADLYVDENSEDADSTFRPISNPVIALNIVSIEDSGKIVYLNSDLLQYDVPNSWTVTNEDGSSETKNAMFKYHILGGMIPGESQMAKEDIDSYRNTLSSGYSVFKSKTSGKLAILAELIMIDSYSVTHRIEPKKVNGEIIEGSFDIIIHTDIEPKITPHNYLTVPKLQYYHLSNSQGYIQTSDPQHPVELFTTNDNGDITVNSSFTGLKLSDLKELTTENKDEINLEPTLSETAQFNFPKPLTYHGRMIPFEGDLNGSADVSYYTKFTEGKYHRLKSTQLNWSKNRIYYVNELRASFYQFNNDENEYVEWTDVTINNSHTYYIKTTKDVYHDVKRNEAEFKDKGRTFYKLVSEPQSAGTKEVEDVTIEKYQYVEYIDYKEATKEQKYDGTKIYTLDGTTYIQHLGEPEPGVTYYVQEVTQNLKFIGTEIDRNEYPGEIFYFPSTKVYVEANAEDEEIYWDFVKYPLEAEEPYGCPVSLYWKKTQETYKAATESEVLNYKELELKLYYSPKYILVSPDNINIFPDSERQLFIVVPSDVYVSSKTFVPNENDNYIQGYDKPTGVNEPEDGYPKDDPITLYTVSDFIPENLGDDFPEFPYDDVKLANIKLPIALHEKGIDLPFKYDYTLVPCMNYGRLDHLAVSNTVDFSKLHNFNQSTFTTWKYHIDGDQLRLTFGAEVYDTYETDKVDGLILEFYDLWGFAGSLEITDKKAYSGIFTKVLPLNSKGALSVNKVYGNQYRTDYKHNINIFEKLETPNPRFGYNNLEVTNEDPDKGWQEIPDKDNDCGTLYSNLLYGVKAYLRTTINKGNPDQHYTFKKTNEFFLYTLPIYNEYYYTIDNFNNIHNPKLDLVLTYKLQDNGTKLSYNKDSIVNGFCPTDKAAIDLYTAGECQSRTLELTKYYSYKGTTDLYLELGLNKDYESINLRHSSALRNLFSCKIKLYGDDSNTSAFSVYSNDAYKSIESALNYVNKDNIPINLTDSSITIGNGSEFTIGGNYSLSNYSFITNDKATSIPIDYNFIVGYNISINNITPTSVPATTVCALCHMTDGVYNYEDFGVYEKEEEGGKILYLSDTMYFNSGNHEKSVFGICRQYSTDENADMSGQCTERARYEQEASSATAGAGKLNSGKPLEEMSKHIGKLAFCQPHVHGLVDTCGVNIWRPNNKYGISPHYQNKAYGETGYDYSWGKIVFNDLYKYPRYNLCLNTEETLKYYSTFYSMLDYSEVKTSYLTSGKNQFGYFEDIKAREFSGFSSSQIEKFNKKLMQSMKGIYAYNPDYDTLATNVGEVSITDNEIRFVSNIVSYDANITFPEGKTLNDYIYIGSVLFSRYLDLLKINSESRQNAGCKVYNTDDSGKTYPLPQVEFKENLEYCGGSGTQYLISSLNYKLPYPQELEDELSFKANNNIIVKHHDNTYTRLENGTLNKKALYGFNESLQKLVQLDVTNYNVEDDGTISLLSSTGAGEADITLTKDQLLEAIKYSEYGNHTIEAMFPTEEGDVPINLYVSISPYTVVLPYPPSDDTKSVIMVNHYSRDHFDVSINVWTYDSKDGYSYRAELQEVRFILNGRLLDASKVSLGGNTKYSVDLYKQSYENLKNLASPSYTQMTDIVVNGKNTTETRYNYDFWAAHSDYENMVVYNGSSAYNNTISYSNTGFLTLQMPNTAAVSVDFIELYDLDIQSIKVNVKRTASIANVNSSVVPATKTAKHYKYANHKYEVLYPKACFRGTSLTINDLVYRYNDPVHRLYVRDGNYEAEEVKVTSNHYIRPQLWYRDFNENIKHGNSVSHDTYYYKGTWDNYNRLIFFTGPSFTVNNLE